MFRYITSFPSFNNSICFIGNFLNDYIQCNPYVKSIDKIRPNLKRSLLVLEI